MKALAITIFNRLFFRKNLVGYKHRLRYLKTISLEATPGGQSIHEAYYDTDIFYSVPLGCAKEKKDPARPKTLVDVYEFSGESSLHNIYNSLTKNFLTSGQIILLANKYSDYIYVGYSCNYLIAQSDSGDYYYPRLYKTTVAQEKRIVFNACNKEFVLEERDKRWDITRIFIPRS